MPAIPPGTRSGVRQSAALLPLHQLQNLDQLAHQVLGITRQRGAAQIHIVLESLERQAHAGLQIGQPHERRAPKDQPDKAVRRPRGGVEEGSPRFIRRILVIGLRVQPGQEDFAGGLDGVLARHDAPGPGPGGQVGVEFRMCRIHGHGRKLARVFREKAAWSGRCCQEMTVVASSRQETTNSSDFLFDAFHVEIAGTVKKAFPREFFAR